MAMMTLTASAADSACKVHIARKWYHQTTIQRPNQSFGRSCRQAYFANKQALSRTSQRWLRVTCQKLAQDCLLEGSIYDHPPLYDLLFCRDYAPQVDFLQQVYADRHGQPATSCLELGCGPAHHSMLLAQRGLEVFALDQNHHMVAHAKALAGKQGVSINFLVADMRDFSLPRQVDLVFLLMGGISHALTNADTLAVLTAANRALKQSGLLVLEMQFPGAMALGDTWEVVDPQVPGRQLQMVFGQEDDEWCPIHQVLNRTIFVTVTQDGMLVVQLHEVVPSRVHGMQEMLLFAQLSGFKLQKAYGYLDIAEPFEDEAPHMVLCLEKL